MGKMLQTNDWYLTPLSPIYVGCGQEYDDLNSCVHEDKLLGFNPLALMQLMSRHDVKLLCEAEKANIKSFFEKNLKKVLTYARSVTPYKQKLTPIKRLPYIERVDYDEIYLPFSSVKGSLLANVDDDTLRKEVSRNLRVGDFLLNEQAHPSTCIVVSQRFKKSDGRLQSSIKDPLEIIEAGCYRAFCARLSLRVEVSKQWVIAHNQDMLQRFKHELPGYLKCANSWASRMVTLLKDLEPKLLSGQLALICLGRQGKYLLGAHSSVDQKPAKGLWIVNQLGMSAPLGWALIEWQEEEISAVKMWCDQVRRSASGVFAIKQKRENLRRAHLKAQEEELKKAKEQEQEQAKVQLQLNQLTSENQRKVFELIRRIESYNGDLTPTCEMTQKIKAFLEAAQANLWTEADKQYLLEHLPSLLKARKMYQGKNEKYLKSYFKGLQV